MPISNPLGTTQPPIVQVNVPSTKSTNYAERIKNVTTETTIEIAPTNTFRQSLTIFNRGENAVLIDVSPFLTNTTGYMLKLEPGAFYESLTNYTGSFNAVADAATSDQPAILDIREFNS